MNDRDFESWIKILETLHLICEILIEAKDVSQGSGCLHSQPQSLRNYLEIFDNFDFSAFCARHAGFYLHRSISSSVNMMWTFLGSSEAFFENNGIIYKIFKFIIDLISNMMNPEMRSENIFRSMKKLEVDHVKVKGM